MNGSGNSQARQAVFRRGDRVQAQPGSGEQGRLGAVSEVLGAGDPDCVAVVRLDNGRTAPLKLAELAVIRSGADLLPPGAVPAAGDVWDGPGDGNGPFTYVRADSLHRGDDCIIDAPGWIGPPVMRVVDRTVILRREPVSVRVRLASQRGLPGHHHRLR